MLDITNDIHRVTIEHVGAFSYIDASGTSCRANFPLFLIRLAWDKGEDFEDLADGFGAGMGTLGDWSAIRDSSEDASSAMLERAVNFHFGGRS
jgi:hypothetical protein